MNKKLSHIKMESFQSSFFRFQTARARIEGHDRLPNGEGIIKTVTFQVTEDCSLNCTYCYQTNKSKKVMTIDDAKKFIDILISESYNKESIYHTSKTKGVVLEFIGGEPLLEVKLIKQIIEYFKFRTITENHIWAINSVYSMISNGVHYFDDEVQSLIKDNIGKLDFSVTLDGCKELHDSCRIFANGEGSYKRAEAACIHFMENYNKDMTTKLTIAPENLNWVSKAFINLYNMGYRKIHGNCIYEAGWKEDSPIIFYNELKKLADFIIKNDIVETTYFAVFNNTSFKKVESNNNYCGSNGCMIAIDCDGNILPCQRFSEISMGKDKAFTIGHINSGISKSEEHIKNINDINSITRESQSTQKCMECSIASGCGWCTALNLEETGSVNKRVTHICQMHKARALANMYFWSKIKKLYPNEGLRDIIVPKDIALEIISEEEYNMLVELSK